MERRVLSKVCLRDISTVMETLEVKEGKVDRKKTNNSLGATKHKAIKLSICSTMFFPETMDCKSSENGPDVRTPWVVTVPSVWDRFLSA